MAPFTKSWLWSLALGTACACGARTELDNIGYDDSSDDLDVGTVNPINTLAPPVAPTAPPPVGTVPPPTTPPVTPPISTPTVTPVPPPPSTTTVTVPCTDGDAPQTLLRIVIPPQTPPISTCGDGSRQTNEECDTPGGPGCLPDCTMEKGWVCPPNSSCFSRCGDGIAVGSEQCDHGNTLASDGCDSTCSIEWDYCLTTGNCPALVNGYCGNGVAEFGEGCDDSGETDYCSAACQVKPSCDVNGECLDVCGDGVLSLSEQCDDGNVRVDDGCDGSCAIEPGYSCTVELRPLPSAEPLPPDAEQDGVDGGVSSGADPNPVMHPYSACSPLCGDGIQQRGEQCDFAIHGPCYGDCTLSVEFCGNGFVDAGESCDDGVNDGHSLAGCPPGCQVGYCGDGIVQVGEACDLGKESNNGAYRACTSYCQLAARCGDGIVQVCGYEECDDGNQLSNDGCSAFCNFERLPL